MPVQPHGKTTHGYCKKTGRFPAHLKTPRCTRIVRYLDNNDIDCCRAFLALFNVEGHIVSFVQGAKT